MLVLGWLCRNRLNPDAVHYLRLASYYVSGRPDLAVSGHWSPLISCLMAPLLGMGIDPLVTARIVSGLSGLLFWFGSLLLLKRLGLSPPAVAAGGWCLTFAYASWSVAEISPDSLGAGLLCFAIGLALADDWLSNWKRQCLVGGLLALAYYGKAVALPMGILTCLGVAGWRIFCWSTGWTAAVRSVALTFMVCLALVSPWVTLLSLKYHRFNISTASRAASVLVSPQSATLDRPFDLAIVPEPGRISVVESFDCPSVWSPFASVANAKHQVRVLFKNGIGMEKIFRAFDFFSIGFISLVIVLILALSNPALIKDQKWAFGVVPILFLSVIYLPAYCADQRYYWVLWPFFLALAFGLAELVLAKVPATRVSRFAMYGLIASSFSLYPLMNCLAIVRHHSEEKGVFDHREMARRLKEKHLQGPVADSSALYVAFFLNQPCFHLNRYYGDTTPATVTQFINSGAKLIIVNRNEPIASEFTGSRFRDLDKDIFETPQVAAQSEIKAFELLP